MKRICLILLIEKTYLCEQEKAPMMSTNSITLNYKQVKDLSELKRLLELA